MEPSVDPRLVAALCEQLRRRPKQASRVGWKVGRGDREQIGGQIVVGHPTSETTLEAGNIFVATLIVNGVVRATAPVAEDFAATLRKVATVLDGVGERLRAGDRLITGSVVQVPVSAGDEVIADCGSLGSVRVAVA